MGKYKSPPQMDAPAGGSPSFDIVSIYKEDY